MKESTRIILNVGAVAVVVLVTGVMVWIVLLPILNPPHRHVRTDCAVNLKNLGTMVAMYAAANHDALPSAGASPGGSWMSDQSADWPLFSAAPLAPGMTVSKYLYCPANTRQDPAVLWGGPGATIRITGYVWMNERPGMPSVAGLRTPAPGTTPVLEYYTKMSGPRRPSDTVLALDWIVSSTPAATGATWTGITAAGRPGIYDTSHMAGKTPAGGSSLLFDCHVEWRNFTGAKATAVPQTPTGPAFWFPGN